MFKEVVIQSFEKAGRDMTVESNKTSQSRHISEHLWEDFKFQVSDKTLRNLYDKCLESNVGDIQMKSSYAEHLSLYLGYNNFHQFLADNNLEEKKGSSKPFFGFFMKHRVALLISIFTIVAVFIIISLNKQRWMVWENDHYVEVDFDAEKFELAQLKLYNEDRIENFRKVMPDCSTEFFTKTGDVNLWYGKNLDGTYDYFTSDGKHPHTGKGLKDITEYMIKKYLCDDY